MDHRLLPANQLDKDEVARAYNIVIYRSGTAANVHEQPSDVPPNILRSIEVFCTKAPSSSTFNQEPFKLIPHSAIEGPAYVRWRTIGTRPDKEPRMFVIVGRFCPTKTRWHHTPGMTHVVLEPLCNQDMQIFRQLVAKADRTAKMCVPFDRNHYGFTMYPNIDAADNHQYAIFQQEYYHDTDHYQTSPVNHDTLQEGDAIVVQFFTAVDVLVDGSEWLNFTAVKMTKVELK